MGLYRFITDEETRRMKYINSCEELNKLFQECLKYYEDLLIEEEYYYEKHKWWVFNGKKLKKFKYTLYEEVKAFDKTPYQAKYIFGIGNDLESVQIYLNGVLDLAYYLKNKGKL